MKVRVLWTSPVTKTKVDEVYTFRSMSASSVYLLKEDGEPMTLYTAQIIDMRPYRDWRWEGEDVCRESDDYKLFPPIEEDEDDSND